MRLFFARKGQQKMVRAFQEEMEASSFRKWGGVVAYSESPRALNMLVWSEEPAEAAGAAAEAAGALRG